MNLHYLFKDPDGFLLHPSEVKYGKSGEFFIPLKEDKSSFEQYFMQYKIYEGNGEYKKGKYFIEANSVTKDMICFEIEGIVLKFKRTKNLFKYKGKLKFESLNFPFQEIKYDENNHEAMEKLFEEKNLVLVGCSIFD